MNIPGYTRYASSEACELASWAIGLYQKNKSRVEATKIKKIADKMEDKYRNSKKYKRKNNIRNCKIYKEDLLIKTGIKKPPPMPPTKSKESD